MEPLASGMEVWPGEFIGSSATGLFPFSPLPSEADNSAPTLKMEQLWTLVPDCTIGGLKAGFPEAPASPPLRAKLDWPARWTVRPAFTGLELSIPCLRLVLSFPPLVRRKVPLVGELIQCAFTIKYLLNRCLPPLPLALERPSLLILNPCHPPLCPSSADWNINPKGLARGPVRFLLNQEIQKEVPTNSRCLS